MTGTAESYVFEEMGTAFLLLRFLYGTYPHDQPELYSGCRRSIVQDKIVQSVGKASLYRSGRKKDWSGLWAGYTWSIAVMDIAAIVLNILFLLFLFINYGYACISSGVDMAQEN